jgi:type IV pilus assembly protein PilB
MIQHHQPAPSIDAAPRMPIGEMLVKRGVITTSQLEQALEHQRQKGHKKLLGEVLVELNFATEQQVLEVLAETYGVPFVSQTARIADPKIVELLSRDFLEEHKVLPLFLVRGVLTVAVPEPANLFLVEEVQRVTGYEVQIVAATAAEIEASLRA